MVTFHPTNNRINQDERLILKNGQLLVERKAKYRQMGCFAKLFHCIFHHNRYNQTKILTALSKCYSNSLTVDETATLKKNIKAVIASADHENIAVIQMSAFKRFFFNRKIVDTKPFKETFDLLANKTLKSKLLELKVASDKIDEDFNSFPTGHLSIQIPGLLRIHEKIQDGLKIVQQKNAKPRSPEDKAQLKAAEDQFLNLKSDFEKLLLMPIDEVASSHTDTLMNNLQNSSKITVKMIQECKESLEKHLNIITQLNKFALPIKSIAQTKHAIATCEASIIAFEEVSLKEEIEALMTDVESFPLKNPYSPKYPLDANSLIYDTIKKIKKLQSKFKVGSSNFISIDKQIKILDEYKDSLALKRIQSMAEVHNLLLEVRSNSTAGRKGVNALEKLILRAASLEKALKTLNSITPLKFDLLKIPVDEAKKQVQNLIDEDKKIIEKTKKQISKADDLFYGRHHANFSVDPDYKQNTASLKILNSHIECHIYKSVPKALQQKPMNKEVEVLFKQREIALKRALLQPYFDQLQTVRLNSKKDLQSLVQDAEAIKAIKSQYKFLKDLDTKKDFERKLLASEASVHADLKEISKKTHKECKKVTQEFLMAHDFWQIPKDQTAEYEAALEETLQKLTNLSQDFTPVVNAKISKKAKAYIKEATSELESFKKKKTKDEDALKESLEAIGKIEELLKSCKTLEENFTFLIDNEVLTKISNFEEYFECGTKLDKDFNELKNNIIPEMEKLKLKRFTKFCDESAKELRKSVDSISRSHRTLSIMYEDMQTKFIS